MDTIKNLVEKLKGTVPEMSQRSASEPTYEDYVRRSIEAYNSEQGELTGYDCKKCLNKGFIAAADEGEMRLYPCGCQELRRSLKLMEASGINPDYTLHSFNAREDWQKLLLAAAWRYLMQPAGWFYAGGQVGAGKTHICTGIVRELLNRGLPARYMLWRDDTVQIKASVKDAEEYAALVEPLKTVKILYIDDFFKTNSGTPTTADINLAFEILNARYNRPELLTIISSEYYLDELVTMDEAVGSRIYERAKNYQNNIGRQRGRNYRLRKPARL